MQRILEILPWIVPGGDFEVSPWKRRLSIHCPHRSGNRPEVVEWRWWDSNFFAFITERGHLKRRKASTSAITPISCNATGKEKTNKSDPQFYVFDKKNSQISISNASEAPCIKGRLSSQSQNVIIHLQQHSIIQIVQMSIKFCSIRSDIFIYTITKKTKSIFIPFVGRTTFILPNRNKTLFDEFSVQITR